MNYEHVSNKYMFTFSLAHVIISPKSMGAQILLNASVDEN